MAVEYANGVLYEYSKYYGHTVCFTEDWQGELTELRLAECVGENKVKRVKIEKLPASIRKLWISADVERITLAHKRDDALEEVEVDAANKHLRSDGHALYSADGKTLIRLLDQNMETYTVADGTETLDGDAFSYCKSLKKIMIPASVQWFSQMIFGYGGFAEGCAALEEVSISPDNPYMTSDGKAVYSKDGKTLFCVTCDGLGDYAVAEGTELMAENAFECRVGLKRVILPASLKGIQTAINREGFHIRFQGWEELPQFEVAENNPYLGYENYTFYSADKKKLLQVLKDTEEYKVHEATEIIAPEAFEGVPSLKKVLLPEGLKVIEKHAFKKCKSLVTIGCQPDISGKRFVFPTTLEEIGEGAFTRGYADLSACDMEEIWLGENIRTISNSAFLAFKVGKFTALGCVDIGMRAFGTNDAREKYIGTMLIPAVNPSKIKKPIQEEAVRGFCKEALAGNALCEAGKKAYQAFLKRNKKRYLEKVEENLEVVRYMMDCGLIEDTDIDGMIEQVDGEKAPDIKAELIEYSKRFTLDGFDREMKKMDQEAEKEEKKQKKALAKEEYEALPLSERAGMKYKLSSQAKVELLEEAVLFGTLEDLKNVCKVHGPFEFTARALGMAVRCRTADFTQELLNNGATFVYEAAAAFTRKYNCVVKVTNKYSYNVNYALLALVEVKREERLEQIKDMPVMSAEDRCRSIELICRAGTSEKPVRNLLYHAILNCEAEITDMLKACGVNQLNYIDAPMVFVDNFVSMDAAAGQERFQFTLSLPMEDTDKLYWVLNALLEVSNGQKIYFSGPELTGFSYRLLPLCAERVFELVMAGKVDISKAKPTEIINCCLKAGNIKGLQYALDQGWAANKAALLKAAKKLNIEEAVMLEWLNLP